MDMFNEDGSLVFKTDAYFNEYNDVDVEVLAEIKLKMHRLPADSPAVALWYANEFSEYNSAYNLFVGV